MTTFPVAPRAICARSFARPRRSARAGVRRGRCRGRGGVPGRADLRRVERRRDAGAGRQATAAATRKLCRQDAIQQLEQFLAAQPRVPIVAGGAGAAVVIVKFNDYQCPPCGRPSASTSRCWPSCSRSIRARSRSSRATFRSIPSATRSGGAHQAACEAAVAVRLAREKGKADAMEDWLFANQAALTPEMVREGRRRRSAGVTDFDARYADDAGARAGRHRPGRAA